LKGAVSLGEGKFCFQLCTQMRPTFGKKSPATVGFTENAWTNGKVNLSFSIEPVFLKFD